MNEKQVYMVLKHIIIPHDITADQYQFYLDLKASNALGTLTPLKFLAKQLINAVSSISVGSRLMEAVKVGPDQFSWLHKLSVKAAMVLSTDLPPVFVKQDPHPNAYTFGVDESKASIVITSGLLEIVTPQELLFIIGHELGHFQCNHVLYHMLAKILSGGFKFLRVRNLLLELALKGLSVTAGLAIYAWARRSEISADRAGLIVCQNYDAAASALAKLSAGLADQDINIKAYLSQLEDVKQQWSGIMVQASEAFHLHPYLPKRIAAIELFQSSEVFQSISGENKKTVPLEDIDKQVSALLFNGERPDSEVE